MRRRGRDTAYLPDNFLIMLRNDKITPYTSFASSSNGRALDFGPSGGACEGTEESWPMATTNPVVEERVLRGLLKVESFAEDVSTACGATARETALRIPPPSTAGFRYFVRCQS